MGSEKKPTIIKNMKAGSFVLVDDVPYKVTSLTTSKPGKHGGAKAKMSVSGLFTTVKKHIVKPASTKVDVPMIEKRSMQVIAFIGDNAQLMDLEDYAQHEVEIPEEFKGKLTEGDEVLVWVWGKYASIQEKKK